MKLTYKFNNDEKTVNVEKMEYLSPSLIQVYAREGDTLYVNSGDFVAKDQLIKESSNEIKTYATISGSVEIANDVVSITSDGNNMIDDENNFASISELKKDEIISTCEELGIEYENKPIATKLRANSKILVVNGMDIEPYQFNSNYLFQEQVQNLLETMSLISRRFNIDAYLLLSKYDDNNVNAVNSIISRYPDLIFKVVPEVFPFNTNALITKKYFNEYRKEDILFLDTFALYKVFVALASRKPVAERYMTICLPAEDKAYVIKVKYGTNILEMLNNTVGEAVMQDKDIYLNNFMRKVKCDNIGSLIVSDNIKTIFLFMHEDRESSPCILCGKCVDICPVKINPLAKKLDSACIRCGLCNYVCPANLNLISKEK